MTSIAPANPLPYVSSLVRSGYESMANASRDLNPIQLMVVMPGRRPVQPDLFAAGNHARAGLASIDGALGFKGSYSTKVADALTSARTEALEGIQALEAKYLVAIDYPTVVAPRFDSSANWLNIAGDLLALEGGTPFRPFGI
jgi:hypothetical protein